MRLTRIARVLALIFVLIIVTSCGSEPKASTQTGMPQACLQQTPVDVSGMTDPERQQAYASAAAQGWGCYAAWIASLDLATIPYRSLPHTGMEGQFLPPEGVTLSEAEANATVVVRADVASIKPLASGFGTNVTVSVSATYKGQPATSLTIRQASHIEPQDHWQNIVIVDADNAPLLLPGDAVFLLLKSGPEGLYQESYTGTFYVVGGAVQPLARNPFASQVNGEAATAFAAALAAATA